jgi:hypothetical protein
MPRSFTNDLTGKEAVELALGEAEAMSLASNIFQ